MNNEEPEVLFQSTSPNGNIYAVVEQDSDTCYFYLHGDKDTEFELKSCWVRNLRPAPEDLDARTMRDGNPPMLPRAFCRQPLGAPPLRPDRLSVIWAEEGDAAALREDGEIIAIIPSWSGHNGFHGYARDCIGNGPVSWELGTPSTNAQFERYEQAEGFRKEWDSRNLWRSFQGSMIEAIEHHYGKHSNYYAIDGGVWPPRALLRIPAVDSVRLITLGISLRPQPKVEMHFEDPVPRRRIELGISLDASIPDEEVKQIARSVGRLSSYPWNSYTFLGEGHTIPLDAFATISGGALPFALFSSQLGSDPGFVLPTFRGDPVTLLWMIPISASEKAYAQQHGSADLAQRLRERGFEMKHSLRRPEVV